MYERCANQGQRAHILSLSCHGFILVSNNVFMLLCFEEFYLIKGIELPYILYCKYQLQVTALI